MNKFCICVSVLLTVISTSVIRSYAQTDWTDISLGETKNGFEYRRDGLVKFNGSPLNFCTPNEEDPNSINVSVSSLSKKKKLAIVVCWDENHGAYEGYVVDTTLKKMVSKDIVPKHWTITKWFSWSPDERFLILSAAGEVTNGDMAYVDLVTGRGGEITFRSITKSSDEMQEFEDKSVSWLSPNTYRVKLYAICNPFEDDSGKCDVDKVLRSEMAQVNLVTLGVTYGVPVAKTSPVQSYKKPVPKTPALISKESAVSFRIDQECGWGAGAGCKEQIVTFVYHSGLKISVFLGDTGSSATMRIVQNKNSIVYRFHSDPSPHFLEVDPVSSDRADWDHHSSAEMIIGPDRSKRLLDVYRLAETFAWSDQDTRKKKYTETGKFAVLRDLRESVSTFGEAAHDGQLYTIFPNADSQFMQPDGGFVLVPMPAATPKPMATPKPTLGRGEKPLTGESGSPIASIRQFDLKNFTFENIGRTHRTVMFQNGVSTETSKDDNFFSGSEVNTAIDSITYVDFDKDGSDEAVLKISTNIDLNAGAFWEGDYIVCRYVGGKIVTIFSTNRYRPESFEIRGTRLVLKASVAADGDPNCCPSQTETSTYEWQSDRFVLLSKILVSTKSNELTNKSHITNKPVVGGLRPSPPRQKPKLRPVREKPDKYSGLTESDLRVLATKLIEEENISNDCAAQGSTKAKELFERVNRLRLSPDGDIGFEVFGQGCACIGARRCGSWLFMKGVDGYRLLADGSATDGFEVLKTITNGYYDVRTTLPDSFLRGIYFQNFRFNGRNYDEKESGCIPITQSRAEARRSKLPPQCVDY